MNAAAQRRLTPWLAGGLLVLALLLLSGLGKGVRWDAPRPPAPLPRLDAMQLPKPPSIEQFAQVWERPLFSSDRHPTASADGGAGVSLGDLELTGIILTPGLKMALLRNKNQSPAASSAADSPSTAGAPPTGDEVRVRLGDTVPGGQWTLHAVEPRRAVFVSGSSRVELSLPVAAPLSLVPTPAAASSSKPGSDQGSPNTRRAALREFVRRHAHAHSSQAAAAKAASSRDH